MQELRDDFELRQSVERFPDIFKSYDSYILDSSAWFPLLYFLIRIHRPSVVIETGCATGTTTSLILKALEKNQYGQLYSVDRRFPQDWLSKRNLATGFLIPTSIKSRWIFREGDLKTELPQLFQKLGQVDFFYHDSDHTYVHQMWEYLSAWQYMSAGGILASDDITHNTAFFDFGRQISETTQITRRGRNFGMIVKSRSPSDYFPYM